MYNAVKDINTVVFSILFVHFAYMHIVYLVMTRGDNHMHVVHSVKYIVHDI